MKFGITQSFSCSYLPDEQEQLLVFAGQTEHLPWRYGQLIQLGFRRSGEQVYRPHCPSCQACQSVRVPVREFRYSRSQKRLHNRNKHFSRLLNTQIRDSYYPLYERYINARHKDGAMYPPSRSQFDNFIHCQWKPPLFLEAWHDDKLIAVAVTDSIDIGEEQHALSALYTFFDPDYEAHSIGTWMILSQVETARELKRDYLYLGYQVDGCQKMAYKQKFQPFESFINNKWQRFDKKSAVNLYTPPDIG
ncbi:arginyltransferase [Alteromonas halophila]|uniref:Aspartate/glutamate leucyltransferase n=1 Tax=Alteromonas halophila TaxID=516698 RepID=A0A918MYP9_9ALTE|nr:arginyltransferase [Alteromonas halophila]GGW89060.1 putative arginyl-tRNA--protein transferase [Alteromonas halophila]